MELETDRMLSTQAKMDHLYHLARGLGEMLSQTFEFQDFLEMAQAINHDSTVQRLLGEIRLHQTALQWGQDVTRHAAELDRLEQELEALPLFQDYRQAERQVCNLFLEVDRLISRAAGVDFAANARRSCCG